MYWENLELPWKEAFLQGWIAFCRGNIPIGSVICDQNGEILSKAGNRMNEDYFPNGKVAHAEAIAVQSLDLRKYSHPRDYTVYACMEPCPMCFGTIVMGNIRTIRIAARDRYAGATEIAELSDYVKSKGMKIHFEPGIIGSVQITMQSYFEHKNAPERSKPVIDKCRVDYCNAVDLAMELAESNYFEAAMARKAPFSSVFEDVCIKLCEKEMKSKAT
jgi:tRNA(Arg) A34 adenosine deaminase TadA